MSYRAFVHEMAWWDLDEEEIKEIAEGGLLGDWNSNPNLHIDRFTFLPEMFSAYHGNSVGQKALVSTGFPFYGFLRIFQEAHHRVDERKETNKPERFLGKLDHKD